MSHRVLGCKRQMLTGLTRKRKVLNTSASAQNCGKAGGPRRKQAMYRGSHNLSGKVIVAAKEEQTVAASRPTPHVKMVPCPHDLWKMDVAPEWVCHSSIALGQILGLVYLIGQT